MFLKHKTFLRFIQRDKLLNVLQEVMQSKHYFVFLVLMTRKDLSQEKRLRFSCKWDFDVACKARAHLFSSSFKKFEWNEMKTRPIAKGFYIAGGRREKFSNLKAPVGNESLQTALETWRLFSSNFYFSDCTSITKRKSLQQKVCLKTVFQKTSFTSPKPFLPSNTSLASLACFLKRNFFSYSLCCFHSWTYKLSFQHSLDD